MGNGFEVLGTITTGLRRVISRRVIRLGTVCGLLLSSALLLSEEPKPDPLGIPRKPAGNLAGNDDKEKRESQRAVADALNWLARHQSPDGSWSIDFNTKNCKGGVCNGGGSVKADVGATGLALLPFYAAGHSHLKRGEHQVTIAKGAQYLVRIQKPSGALSPNNSQEMYEHGIGTMALCEAFRVSKDPKLRFAAQLAIDYLQKAQNDKGGWRYKPRAPDTDTSVVSWQIKALQSGQLAGLKVDPQVLKLAKEDLERAGSGNKKGKFGYMPGRPPTPPMTGAALVCMQFLGTKPDDPLIEEGIEYLMANLPDIKKHNVYYWHSATQALQNSPGEACESWNKKMRSVLVESQESQGCAKGSWNPENDPWGVNGGRVFITALACITLQKMDDSPKADAKKGLLNGEPKGILDSPKQNPSPLEKLNPDSNLGLKPEASRLTAEGAAGEQRKLVAKLAEVRSLVGERKFDDARRLLKEIDELANTPAAIELQSGMQLATNYNEQFWQAVKTSMSTAQGELTVGTSQVVIISSSVKEIQLRLPGRDTTYKYENIPQGLAVALAQRVFDNKSANYAALGSYYFAAKNGDQETARKLLQEANDGGTDTKAILKLLDEREIIAK